MGGIFPLLPGPKRRDEYRYYAQLVLQGVSYQKPLLSFCHELKTDQHKKRRLERKLNRQRRANNPQNYDAKGRVKKGRLRWKDSRGYKAYPPPSRICRAQTRCPSRSGLHGRLVHEIVRSGNSTKTEKLS